MGVRQEEQSPHATGHGEGGEAKPVLVAPKTVEVLGAPVTAMGFPPAVRLQAGSLQPSGPFLPPATAGSDGGQHEQVAGGLERYLLSLVPGEGDVELGEDSLLMEAGQLLAVQVILTLAAAAVVKHRLAHLFAYRVTQHASAGSLQPPTWPPHLPLSCQPRGGRAVRLLLFIRGSSRLIPRSTHML